MSKWKWNHVCIFGCSIAYGSWDYEYGGWVARLRKFLEQKPISKTERYLVYNVGVSGNSTTDILKRFETECKSRSDGIFEFIIFAVGTNDSLFISDKNYLVTPPEKVKENIQKLIKIARKFTKKIIFIGLTPVDETKTTPLPWDKFKHYKNEHIEKNNEIIKKACKENGVYFIEMFEKWIKMYYKDLLNEVDGLHPNTEGHEKIFKIVKEFLIENKII